MSDELKKVPTFSVHLHCTTCGGRGVFNGGPCHCITETIAELRKENERLSASLQLVAQMGGLTLLGPSDSDYDGLTNRLPDQYWAHELGAARAFSQAAEVAKEALKDRQ